MNVHPIRSRLGRAVVVVVAGSVVGITGALAVSADERPSPADQRDAIAEYARSAGLSGLSPASLSPVDD